ncbi:MAG: response regulator transcription factor [Xanthomonadales bacterium]|nr:response regulator transcription factor [Xanthomonadales bacterium]
MIHLLIADDHPMFRLALRQAVLGLHPQAKVLEAGTLEQAMGSLHEQEVDLVLLDLHMPDSHGLMGLSLLRSEHPAVAVMMISANDDPAIIRRALDHGAAGFLPKSAGIEELKQALECVLDCREYVPEALRRAVYASDPVSADQQLAERLASLTPQQLRVLSRVAQGRLNKQIADELGITERTVKAHVSALFEKLGVRNRTQAGVLLQSLTLADPARSVEPDA